jgi:hypothetical protein
VTPDHGPYIVSTCDNLSQSLTLKPTILWASVGKMGYGLAGLEAATADSASRWIGEVGPDISRVSVAAATGELLPDHAGQHRLLPATPDVDRQRIPGV